MPEPDQLAQDIVDSIRYFQKTIEVLDEDDSNFSPMHGMMTVAQQVAHVARTIDWFVEGPVSGNEWDMDFPKHMEEACRVKSLAAAMGWLTKAGERAVMQVRMHTPFSISRETPKTDPVLPGVPLYRIINAMVEHTAHHRGSLAVYIRLLGKVPPIPYF